MTLSNFRLHKSLIDFSDTKEDSANVLSGILGLNSSTVQVPNREGFVYVRLRDNLHEVIEAYNGVVSPVYNLPVLIKWDKTRYMVVGRDLERYVSWGTTSAYLPLHGASHSFSESGAGDVVWVFSRQFMPWLITPSGSSAADSGMVQGYPYYFESEWKYLATTGTPSLVGNQPTGSLGARMSLLYLDQKENILKLTNGTIEFDASLTGTADIVPYIPGVAQDWHIPLAGVRTVTGTATISWGNLYDLRPHFTSPPTGTGGGGDVSFTGFLDGSVIFVEDEAAAEDNPSFFYDDGGNVLVLGGSGTANVGLANTRLSIQGDGGAVGQEIRVAAGASAYPYLYTYKANGSFDSPTTLIKDDLLSRIDHFGHDGSDYVDKARVDVYATEDWSTNARGTKYQIRTTPTGTAGTQAVSEWEGHGLELLKGIQFHEVYISGTSSYDMDGEDTFLWCDAADGDDIEVVLPPGTNDGQFVGVKIMFDPGEEDGSVVTIDPLEGETIDTVEDTTTLSGVFDAVLFVADGDGNWNKIGFFDNTGALWQQVAGVLSPITSAAILKTDSGRRVNTTRITSTYTILTSDHMIYADTDGGSFVGTLPSGSEGQTYRLANVGTSGNDFIVSGTSVMGSPTQTLNDGEIIILVYNTTEGWW